MTSTAVKSPDVSAVKDSFAAEACVLLSTLKRRIRRFHANQEKGREGH
jgi:hypothetical protein